MTKDKGTYSITHLFVLSTIFGATLLGPAAKPLDLPHNPPIHRPETKSELVEAVRDLWNSIFDWNFLVLIITPKPSIRMINGHGQPHPTTSMNNGFLSRLFHIFVVTFGIFSAAIKRSFLILRSPFRPKPAPRPTILPQYTPPMTTTRINDSLERTIAPPSIAPSASSASDNPIRTPTRVFSPTNHSPKPDLPSSRSTSPTTARFITTLNDLEAQMHNHQFYDLERELEDMDNRMAQMFDFSWIPSKAPMSFNLPPVTTPPETPVQIILPQAPPPARRDRKTIQILPMICEVSENSPDLHRTPPYDHTRWSIITFQPLWGPRAYAGMAY
ncbi:hypothetical protein RHS04_08064 [Rhizoctonia solani]|uniref:Uncharacterized protein n=1 Tax=Rhizoctonia solani TaxID=456999 RepID=A0A8H7LEG4_9AGAM|nr:hypothetical protein RHS04_08064 [Rhizoctonia solani]